MTALHDFILACANAGLGLQAPNGAMPAGRNGPHNHRMTPARNTGHWSILFAHAYELSADGRFADAARHCLDLLISPELRPMGGAIWHRQHHGRNSMNGLIGQAWSMEALHYGAALLGEPRYREVGRELAAQHVFKEQRHLWYQLDLDGSALDIEFTLNQQIWLAATTLMLAEHDRPNLVANVVAFLDGLPAQLERRRSGLLPRGIAVRTTRPGRLAALAREALVDDHALRREVEEGYHTFALAGLALIYQRLPDHAIFRSDLVRRAVGQASSQALFTRLAGNRFAFGYNVPGFELPFALETFAPLLPGRDHSQLYAQVLGRQISEHYDPEQAMLRRKTSDPETLAARVYEVCRLLPYAGKVDQAIADSLEQATR